MTRKEPTERDPARSHAAFLRAIAHVPMQPFREALEELRLRDVVSYGMSGNLMFNTDISDVRLLEDVIAERLGAVTFVRTRSQIARIVAADPYINEPGAAITLLAKPVPAARRREVEAMDFEGTPPLLRGRTLYFTESTRLKGRRSLINPEVLFKTTGTVRSSPVVAQVLARMLGAPASKR